MESGLFHASTGWEHLLPPGLHQLRDAGTVCRRHWDFLVLTPLGCRMLAGQTVTAALLLMPGECGVGRFRAGTVVTYGLSPRDSITFSSLREPVLCVQRALPLACGGMLEPQEFPLPGVTGAEGLLPCVSARLLLTGSPCPP